MRVLLADDQPQVRSALRLLLEERAETIIVGEAGSMAEVLTLLQEQQPDMLLLDWELPCRDCELTLETLRADNAALIVIVLSSHTEARALALAAGANAFVSKGDPPEFLLSTVQQFLHPRKTPDRNLPGIGAGKGIRTLDILLGKQAFYH